MSASRRSHFPRRCVVDNVMKTEHDSRQEGESLPTVSCVSLYKGMTFEVLDKAFLAEVSCIPRKLTTLSATWNWVSFPPLSSFSFEDQIKGLEGKPR